MQRDSPANHTEGHMSAQCAAAPTPQTGRMDHRILAINPGSTSTKIGVFDDDHALLHETVEHPADQVDAFATISDQLPYRRDTILTALEAHGIELESVDAFVGRGGGLLPVVGGTYEVNDIMIDHARRGANGVYHPANLGSCLAHEFAAKYGKPAFVVNPPDTDELCDDARMTGIDGVYRRVHLHALNLKETAIRHAASLRRSYQDCNFIVCHIGGGTSISAHRRGKMIDGNDIVGGDGPIAPTRCGALPVVAVLDYLQDHDVDHVRNLCMRSGGFVDLLGTSDAREVQRRATAGDAMAERAWNAMVYQICKAIGAMAGVLRGDVDGILLGGGMTHSKGLVAVIEDSCGWIAPVTAYPGEFELAAMAAGALRVLVGKERPRVYTGEPTWNGFAA